MWPPYLLLQIIVIIGQLLWGMGHYSRDLFVPPSLGWYSSSYRLYYCSFIFFLSGALWRYASRQKITSFKKMLSSKISRLLVPYFLVGVLYIAWIFIYHEPLNQVVLLLFYLVLGTYMPWYFYLLMLFFRIFGLLFVSILIAKMVDRISQITYTRRAAYFSTVVLLLISVGYICFY